MQIKDGDRRTGTAALTDAYRADIDGLRAIAVLSVVAFHAFPDRFGGGFVGVDVFFVISGFLISGIIFRGLEKRTFGFLSFYARRVRRIFPALIVMMAATGVCGWIVLLADEYGQLGKHMAAGAGFVSNLVFWQEAGYFDNATNTKPLLHLWSLGVEEQFYLLWPLLLYWGWKRGLNLLFLAVVVGVSSLAFGLFRSGTPVDVFFLPMARLWELLCGATLAHVILHPSDYWSNLQMRADARLGALVFRTPPVSDGKLLRDIQSVSGAALIVWAVFWVNKDSTFPTWALAPTLGTCLTIGAGPNSWFNRKVLSNRLAVFFGVISYPLYLWHWPLLSFATIVDSGLPARVVRLEAVLVAVVLAWLTYKLVETPIRLAPRSRLLIVALSTFMTALGSGGLYVYYQDGLPFRRPHLSELSRASADRYHPTPNTTYNGIKAISLGNPRSQERTLLWGDSNIDQYAPRVAYLVETGGLNNSQAVFITKGGCPPIPEINERTHPCAAFSDKALFAIDDPTVRTVVLGALWTQYFRLDYYLRSEGPETLLRRSESAADLAFSSFENLVGRLRSAGKKVVVILEIPTSESFDPHNMTTKGSFFHRLDLSVPQSPRRAEIESYNGRVNQRIQTIAIKQGADVIDPMDYLCSTEVCPIVSDDGAFIYWNRAHLSTGFVRSHADFIDGIFR